MRKAMLLPFALLMGCQSETVPTSNDDQRIVLAAIRAAEAKDITKLGKLIDGATISPPLYAGMNARQLLAPRTECVLGSFAGGRPDGDVVIDWNCGSVPGWTVAATVSGERITRLRWLDAQE
jgi:hypothetical protein